MSSPWKITRLLQALAVTVVALGISLVWSPSIAHAEPASRSGSSAVAKAGDAYRSADTPSAAAGTYCHAGPRPVYSCGPYTNYYVCDAVADIFRMFGDHPATCWYFPQGNLGGGPGWYF